MAQIQEPPPNQQTERIERPAYGPGGFEPAGDGPSAGRVAAIVLMLVAVTLVAAGAGFLLAGGRLPFASTAPMPAPAAAEANTPTAPPANTQPAPTAPAAESSAPTAPTVAPVTAPTSPPTSPPNPTAPPPPTVAPTTPPQPTAQPAPTSPPSTVPKPEGAPTAAQQGVHSPVRPGMDPRMAQIEGRVNEYFAALRDEEYARAQQVCCTAEWRTRFPLDRWQRNFDGVSDLRLVGAPRYQKVEEQEIVVDTDYTFVSGGARRNFTLRWTFKPVGSEWQADLAEAFPT